MPTLDGDAGHPAGAGRYVLRPDVPRQGPGRRPKRDGTSGDLLVTVEVGVPQRVDGSAKESLEAYRDATAGDDPRADLFLEAGR